MWPGLLKEIQTQWTLRWRTLASEESSIYRHYFSFPFCHPASKTVLLNTPVSVSILLNKRGHKIGFFICLRSIVSGHFMHNNWLLAINFSLICKSTKIWPLTEQSGKASCPFFWHNIYDVKLRPHSSWSTFLLESPLSGLPSQYNFCSLVLREQFS